MVDDGETPVVFDLGTGALANLRRHADYDRLAAIVISHMHADHFIDLIPLRYALRYGPRRRRGKLPLHLPPGGLAMLRRLVSAFADEGGEFLSDVYDLHEYDPSVPLAIDGATLRFAHTEHYIPAFAVRWQRGDVSVTYSADTAPDPRVVALARGSDVFVCEATLRHGETEPGMRGHCSAADAARMARDGGVRRLVLTHYGEESTARDLDDAAREHFRGDVVVADDHRAFELGS
ncbi:MBL fold metallo-hydrolase [Vulcanimicrobium alpinum]|uniref:MBL fold metallo-hydrolase n=1 Tax=Vulcanimicrobium alpinum TaxID=3016050 RepID=A0AAN1XWR5_UNVUL|nr:MBL fold metallo-hydrolase [Vulcanimicrobium alpinum]